MADPIGAAAGGAKAVWAGFRAPFRGVGTIARRPGLWPLSIIPTLLLIATLVALSKLAGMVFDTVAVRLAAALGGAGWLGAAGQWVASALVALLLFLAVLLVASLVVPALASPFMDVLAGRVDALPQREESVLRGAVRAVRVALTGLLLVALPQAALWGASIAVPVLAPAWVALGVGVAALGLAYDALDWPLARRGLGVRARIAWMGAHRATVAGLGLGVWVMALVPGLQIVLMPAVVVGGVALVNAEEQRAAGPSPRAT